MLFSDVWVGTLSTFGGAVINRRHRAPLRFVLSDIAGIDDMWLVPVGWLGEETVLLQASFDSPERSVVLQFYYDGTNLEYLAPEIWPGCDTLSDELWLCETDTMCCVAYIRLK